MSAGAIGGGFGGASPSERVNRFAEMRSEDFIRVLVTELTNQDPFEPNDSSAILEQLSSLRNIESQLALKEQLEGLVLQNSVSQASHLIGKFVEGLSEQNSRISGLVTSVRVVDGKAVLDLDTGGALPLGRVELISESQEGGSVVVSNPA